MPDSPFQSTHVSLADIPGLDSSDESPSDVLQAYIRQLLTDYLLVAPNLGEPSARSIVENLIQTHSAPSGGAGTVSEWSWDDAYAIEKALVRIESIERIRKRLLAQRSEYRQLAGDQAFEAYIASAPADISKSTDEELRSDLLQLLAETQWLYSTVGVQQHERDRLVNRVALWSLLFLGVPCLVTIGVIYAIQQNFSIPILLIVSLCGSLGGLISTYRRLQNLSLDGNPAVNLVMLGRSAGLTYWAPAFGAIFAAIFYALLISGLVSGELFPKIDTPIAPEIRGTGITFKSFVMNTGPLGGVDFAKLMVWSFIAGFAERLVPDTIDRLASAASSSKK